MSIRVTRLLLVGKVVLDPFFHALSAVIKQPDNPYLLELLRGSVKPMVRDFDDTPWTILGKKPNLASLESY